MRPIRCTFLGRRLRTAGLGLALLVGPMLGLAPSGVAHAASGDCATSGGQVTCTFTYTGAAQIWTVPAGVTQAAFDVFGAQGGDFQPIIFGGKGGEASATLALVPHATVTIVVGGEGTSGNACPGIGGFNGGGSTSGACPATGGGGATDVRIGGTDLAHRVLVAGGGGSAAGVCGVVCANGGVGGGLTGGAGACASYTGCSGGSGGNQDGTSGSGQLGRGGDSGSVYGTGGGGGGYYGGAGGSAQQGGGGGSGFGPTGAVFHTGVRSGNGQVTITYTPPADTTAPTTTAAASPASPNGINGWYTSPVQVGLAATDPDDAATTLTTREALDDSACGPANLKNLPADCQVYTGPVTVGDGQHTLYYFSVDPSGNAEARQQLAVQVDTKAPSAPVASFSPASVYTDSTGRAFYKNGVTVSYGGSTDPSPGSGVDPSTYTAPQPFGTTGGFGYSGTVKDMAGNPSPATTGTVYVDAVAPTTAAQSSPAPNGQGLSTAPVTVQLSATDDAGGTGVASITYSATGANVISQTTARNATQASPFVAQASLPNAGITTLTYYATDLVGNQEQAHTLAITAQNGQGIIPVVACAALGVPGSYQLAGDLHGAGTCLTIAAAGVKLDLKGHAIMGNGSGQGALIQPGATGAAVQGGTITGFATGVLDQGNNAAIQGLALGGNAVAVELDHASGSAVQGDTGTSGITQAILLTASPQNTIQGNTFKASDEGIVLTQGSGHSSVQGNTITLRGATGGGIVVTNTLPPSLSGGCAAATPANGGDTIAGNTLKGGTVGLYLDCGDAQSSTLMGNQASGQSGIGAVGFFDGNPGCDSNLWLGNAGAKNQACVK